MEFGRVDSAGRFLFSQILNWALSYSRQASAPVCRQFTTSGAKY
jgi:hypothetical protein